MRSGYGVGIEGECGNGGERQEVRPIGTKPWAMA
jgi:hypothetical protein